MSDCGNSYIDAEMRKRFMLILLFFFFRSVNILFAGDTNFATEKILMCFAPLGM
jgi:hypothetical protein